MTSTTRKKRKYGDENRGFNPGWEDAYAFISLEIKPCYLICHKPLNIGVICENKRSYVKPKRHDETNPRNFSSNYPRKSEERAS